MGDLDLKSSLSVPEVPGLNHCTMLTVCSSLRVRIDVARAQQLFIIQLLLALPMLMYVKLIPKR